MKYIGLDIGTTSICGVVFDAGLGEILSTAAEANRAARDGLTRGNGFKIPRRFGCRQKR